MTPEEKAEEVYRIRQAEAYDEALRRIRKAEETGAVKLNLSELALTRLPPELAGLTSLQSLDLDRCTQLWHTAVDELELRRLTRASTGKRRSG